MNLTMKLIFLRKKQGLTQYDLAEKLHVSRQAISRWEKGAAVPSIDNLKVLSELYGVSVDYLLNDDFNPSPEAAGDSAQTPDYPRTSNAGGKPKKGFVLSLILTAVITIMISVTACFMIIHTKAQNRQVPMEDMSTVPSIHSDETFSFS